MCEPAPSALRGRAAPLFSQWGFLPGLQIAFGKLLGKAEVPEGRRLRWKKNVTLRAVTGGCTILKSDLIFSSS